MLYEAATGQLWLIDFSHSRSMSRRVAPGETEIGGTLAYMAPEILQRHYQQLSTGADVWSLGTVLAEWVRSAGLTSRASAEFLVRQIRGKPLFAGEDAEQVLASIRAAFEDKSVFAWISS